jgi:ubiquinol-cytochrome c reductase cytochrome b subunit
MFSAILIILVLPITDLGKSRGLQFRPLSKVGFYVFVVIFIMLMQLGAKHVESPYIELGQVITALYFGYFIVIVPILSIMENTLVDIAFSKIKE